MKKALFGAFIFVDIALIGASAFVMYSYINHKRTLPSLGMPSMPAPSVGSMVKMPVPVPAAPGAQAPARALTPPAPAADSSTRKILFTFHNLHAQKVAIRADFTGWKAEPMQKGANGLWTYQAVLTPGEYAYCYTVDDKNPQKDPANKRTKQIGKAVVSAIVVEPLAPKTPH